MKKDFNNAFCAVRPPGHHAEKQKAMDSVFIIISLLEPIIY